jgi:4-aminobutyrate aminotransferase
MIQLTLDRLVHPDDLAAIVVEPILGEGGYQVPPDDFLPELRSICDRTGALLICDEVQTGLGRTGKWFGFQHSNIVPDIAILGKAIGGGLPLGGIIARADLMDAWWVSAHGTTYGGNPVACVAGLESLLITEDENLIENAVRVGDHMRDRLNKARMELPIIGAVSGRGLMIGVELVTDDGEQLSLDKVKEIVKFMGTAGVIMTRCGPSSLRLTPPLIITMEQADDLLDIMFKVLRDYGSIE